MRSIRFAIGCALAAMSTSALAQQGPDQAQARQIYAKVIEFRTSQGQGQVPAMVDYLESVLREGSKNGNIRIFETVIPSSSAVQGSESAEQPLIHYKPNAPATIAYSALAGEILPGLKGKRQGKVSQPNLSAIERISDDFEIEIAGEVAV